MYNPFKGNFELAKPDFYSIKHIYLLIIYYIYENYFLKVAQFILSGQTKTILNNSN